MTISKKRLPPCAVRIVLCLFALSASTSWLLEAAEKHPIDGDVTRLFTKTETMVPMRDGIKLHTVVFAPKKSRQPLPFIFSRTPYGITDEKGHNGYFDGLLKELVSEGYIFVFQDIRGRYQSEGQFVMFRPPHGPNEKIDEGTDTYDTIDWLLKNVAHNNGRVGILGVSYGGWLTTMALLEPHPALKAASEQASPADQFLGDDFHHNGAFRLSYGVEYAAMMETSKTNFHFSFDTRDTFDWYLRLGVLSNVNEKYLNGKIPTWNDFVKHPNYDEFWQRQAVPPYLVKPTVPNLNVAGWWDQEDFYGPAKIYETFEKNDTKHLNYFVSGPWNHGGWSHDTGRSLGQIDFGSDTATYYREKIQAHWFAYWLKDEGPLNQPEALVFQTGTNKWASYDEWPPRQSINDRKLYFHSGGQLSFDPPETDSEEQFDSYISDPAHPVPYRHRPVQPTYPGGGWPTWLVEDQRFVHLRPDVLSWQTDVLKEPVTVTGRIVAHLFAATSGTDSDWIAKLIDVYPETNEKEPDMGGFQLMIADEVMRGRFRDSFSEPKPIPANQVVEYAIDLHTNDHAFLPGHRIMVQVQSTWFPVIDRNPQKFVDNIYLAAASDYQTATQRIYRSKQYASYMAVPVAVK